jgi:hypothetical protein
MMAKGASLRSAARALGIGAATALRLYRSASAEESSPPPSTDAARQAGPAVAVELTFAPARALKRHIAEICHSRMSCGLPKGHEASRDLVPVIDGKTPGRCEKCGSRAWRLRADGFAQRSVCYPIRG